MKLTFVYAEMPKFIKTLDELDDNTDKWLFVLKNISKLQELPEKLSNRIFKKLFKSAEIAHFTKNEYFTYQESLKAYRDNKAALNTAILEERAVQEKKINQLKEKLQQQDKQLQQQEMKHQDQIKAIVSKLLSNGLSKEEATSITDFKFK